MDKYYRAVIDCMEQAISDILASGDIDHESISKVLLDFEMEIDRRIVNREDIDTICQLRDDLKWLQYDVINE